MEVLDWHFRESKSNDYVPFGFCCSSPAPPSCPDQRPWGADERPTAPVPPPSPPTAETAQEDSRGHDTSPAEEGLIGAGLREETPWLQTAKAPQCDNSIQRQFARSDLEN